MSFKHWIVWILAYTGIFGFLFTLVQILRQEPGYTALSLPILAVLGLIFGPMNLKLYRETRARDSVEGGVQ
jgi:hypothetical protein